MQTVPFYLLTMFAIFWIPIAVLGPLVWKKLDPATKKAFWITLAIMTPLTVAMEYVYLWTDIWTFSEQVDPLLGIRIAGAPVEEFSFWLGVCPFIFLVYLAFQRFFEGNSAARSAETKGRERERKIVHL